MAQEQPPSRLLLVEGVDDRHVVQHLCSLQRDMPDFAISDKQGFPRLKDAIGPEIKVAGRTALGILVDANDDLDARWAAVGHQLRQAAVDLPTLTSVSQRTPSRAEISERGASLMT